MKKRNEKLLLLFLIILLIAVNYSRIDGFFIKTFNEREPVRAERVIDGDTIVINGTSARLLGINTPEKGEYLYAEAKKFLESMAMNKTIYIERHGKDLYKRDLAYIYDNSVNINLEIVKNGYANYYFPEGKGAYYADFANAWNKCIEKNINLCEKSNDECSECIIVEEFGYNKNLVLRNICSYDCNLENWKIKDEGRKTFIFGKFVLKPNSETEITNEDFGKDYVWTKTGDSVFLRDDKGKLVLWESY